GGDRVRGGARFALPFARFPPSERAPRMRILVRAPSNIAIVKYMGKSAASPEKRNIPENPSISMTLSGLCTFLEVRASDGGKTGSKVRLVEEPPAGARGESPKLSESGSQRFTDHFLRCVEKLPAVFVRFGLVARGDAASSYEIRTSNTFPHAAGIASSASSFAALTLATAALQALDREAFRKRYAEDAALRAALGSLSREGSGSSARSFDGPFVSWEGETVEAVPSSLPPLSDLVVVVSSGEKKVGSSE